MNHPRNLIWSNFYKHLNDVEITEFCPTARNCRTYHCPANNFGTISLPRFKYLYPSKKGEQARNASVWRHRISKHRRCLSQEECFSNGHRKTVSKLWFLSIVKYCGGISKEHNAEYQPSCVKSNKITVWRFTIKYGNKIWETWYPFPVACNGLLNLVCFLLMLNLEDRKTGSYLVAANK